MCVRADFHARVHGTRPSRVFLKTPGPDTFHLDAARLREAQERFRALGWLRATEDLMTLTPAGAGNMNLTLRASTGERTFIVKQGRGWVEKYPSIAAPEARTLTEGAFYRAVGRDPSLAGRMPALLGLDAEARMLALDDLGEVSDLTTLYAGDALRLVDLAQLAEFLCRLHALPVADGERETFANHSMRRLNHEHIFVLPFVHDNGLNLEALTPGLAGLAREVADDRSLVAKVTELGSLYLGAGPCLLHGDYYPGSWLRTDQGIRVIDPEFCFLGPTEFDLGVASAHLILADRSAAELQHFFDGYQGSRSTSRELAMRFAGVEILRRLLGVAQLPLEADLKRKTELVRRARALVVAGDA